MKKFLVAASLLCGVVGCVSKTVESDPETRHPAGVGDIGSSTDQNEYYMSRYKLPLTRSGEKKIRVAYNSWSGEWPVPVIDVKSGSKGKTTIQGYLSARELTDRASCTIKNGLYHPWSATAHSVINFYSFVAPLEYVALKDLEEDKIKIPKGSRIIDVAYVGEGYCTATLKIGRTYRSFDTHFGFLDDKEAFKKVTPDDDFSEQWLHLKCEETDAEGKKRTVFVNDKDLLSQPGITQGEFDGYGKVKSQSGK